MNEKKNRNKIYKFVPLLHPIYLLLQVHIWWNLSLTMGIIYYLKEFNGVQSNDYRIIWVK